MVHCILPYSNASSEVSVELTIQLYTPPSATVTPIIIKVLVLVPSMCPGSSVRPTSLKVQLIVVPVVSQLKLTLSLTSAAWLCGCVFIIASNHST